MNDREMRDKIDVTLQGWERRRQDRRKRKVAGAAAGMLLALGACGPEPVMRYAVAVYGVYEADAGLEDAGPDIVGIDIGDVTLYGVAEYAAPFPDGGGQG